MTDLAVVEAGIQAWVEGLSGLEMEWGRQPMNNQQRASILAYPGSIQPRGWDEGTYTYNENTDQQELVMSGVRYFTITLSFRSYNQSLALSARRYAEDFLVLVQSPGSIQTLNAIDQGLAFSGTQSLVDTDYTYNRRRVSQVDMDLLLGLRYTRDDPWYDGAYIKTVNLQPQNYVLAEDGSLIVDEDGEILVDEPGPVISVEGP